MATLPIAAHAARMSRLLRDCASLESACERLINAASEVGAQDDVTVVLVRPAATTASEKQ